MDTQQINNSWYLKSANNSLGGSSDLAALIMTNHDSYIWKVLANWGKDDYHNWSWLVS